MRSTRSQSLQQSSEDVGDQDELNVMLSKKNISNEDEDVFITIALRHIHIIERKNTDKHLTPKVLREKQSTAWETIMQEFRDATSVSYFYFTYNT